MRLMDKTGLSRSRLALRIGAAIGLVGVVALGGCRKSVPETAPVQTLTLPPLQVEANGKWLFTYADDQGHFVTTDDPKAVPQGSRRLVRVIDPAGAAKDRRDGVAVYVVDLDELDKKGAVAARVLSRQGFETGALAQLPPGESSAWAAGAPPPATDAGAVPMTGEPAAPGEPVVTIYGASWCEACKEAQSYLRSKHVPMVEKDIEKDSGAREELEQKAKRFGIPTDRIPILDVRGRLLIGFDRGRLDALLGEAS